MKKILLSILLGFGITSLAFSAEWYEGGTLQKSTMAEWAKGSEENKLATCGDWMFYFYKEKQFNSDVMKALDTYGLTGMKEMANTCVQMLDAASGPETATQSSTELLMLGFMMSGLIEL